MKSILRYTCALFILLCPCLLMAQQDTAHYSLEVSALHSTKTADRIPLDSVKCKLSGIKNNVNITLFTNAKGLIKSFTQLPAGTYRLSCTKHGYKTVTLTLRLCELSGDTANFISSYTPEGAIVNLGWLSGLTKEENERWVTLEFSPAIAAKHGVRIVPYKGSKKK